MHQDMNTVLIFTVVVVSSLIAAVVFLKKLRPELENTYWLTGAAVSVVVMALLSGLAWYNLFFYAFVSILIVLGVREASKHIFSISKGGIVLGVYFGLWLSLPVGALQFST